MSELITGRRYSKRHVGKHIDGFQGVHRGLRIGERNQEGRMLLEFCDANHLYMDNTWSRKADKK